jgi:hypothetical protein
MQDVTVISNTIWDAISPTATETSAGSGTPDDMPPFALLTTDEEREKKAERSTPGTYNVVLNQDSFQNLPEYSDDPDVKKELLSPLRRGSLAASITSAAGRDIAVEGIPVPDDPNIVVLPRFEDIARRNTFSSSKDLQSPISPIARNTIIKSEDSEEIALVEEPASMTENERVSIGQEERYLRQFRYVVWKQLIPAELDQRDGMVRSSVGIFESAADVFPPVSCHHKLF